MRTSKSRTVVSRTFGKVKSRILSMGSVTLQDPDTPAVLIAPPPKTETQPVDESPDISPPRSPISSAKINHSSASESGEGRVPQISTLVITPSTWTIFANPSYPKYAATAYVQFTLTCKPQNAAQAQAQATEQKDAALLLNVPGVLLNLSLELDLTGAHTLIQDFTQYAIPRLEPNGTWLCLVHLGFNEMSLASKLATSWKSLKMRTSKSLRRYNREIIDRWLDILSDDQEKDRVRNGLMLHEDVTVRVKVRYQHSFLSNGEGGTWLEDRAECPVNLVDDDGCSQRSKLDGVIDEEEFDQGSRERTCDDVEEGMMEEMVREYNLIIGPPFML